ncbi:WD40 repeat-like protein [Trametes sanguinea]|nr:WD40 repeat-like protein [Trametes sanguinea]
MTPGLRNLFTRRKKQPDSTPPSEPGESPSRESLQPDGQNQSSSRSRSGFLERLRSRSPRPPSNKEASISPSADAETSQQPGQPDPLKPRWLETTINGLTLALDVVEKAGAVFPPLQAVAGALAAIAKVVKQTSSNADDIRSLQSHIEQLNKLISPEVLPSSDQWPASFRERLSDFERELKNIQHDIGLLSSERLHARVLNVQERAGDIAGIVKSLGWLIQSFIVRGTISLEFGINRVEVKMQQNLHHIDGRFDGVHAHLDGGFAQIHDHMDAIGNRHDQPTSTIPGLHPTLSALYNDSESGHSECEPGTRMEALATIYAWILGPDHPDLSKYPEPVLHAERQRLIMWLYALAGAGKSTLAKTTAQWCYIRRILAAAFFCGRDGDRSNVLAIMPTIAFQLAHRCQIFREALRKAVAENPNVHQMSVASQLEKLIVEPLCVAMEGGSHAFDGAVIIIDALDECKDEEAVSVVVKSLAIHHRRLGPLRILVTSRPDHHIKAGFVMPALAENTQEFPLSRIPDAHTTRDIVLFLRRRLKEIATLNLLGPGWPSEDELSHLAALTELLFIFAATAVRFIADKEAMDPAARLSQLLQAGSKAAAVTSSLTSPFQILDALYLQVLYNALRGLGAVPLAHVRDLLGVLVLAEERLSISTLEALLNFTPGTARRLLSLLTAILVLPEPGDELSPIRLIHLSFANFIVDPSRCTERAFLITPPIRHTLFAERCLRILVSLQHNICQVDVKDRHLLNSEIPELETKIAHHLSPERQYAAKYWAHHLCHAEVDQELLDTLEAFCNDHLLDWLEALSLLGCVDVAVTALQSAQRLLKRLPLPPTTVVALLYDCERIVRTFYEGISSSFFEVLRATAAFAPVNSILRQRHAADLPGMVQLRRGRDTDWRATFTSTDTGGADIRCLEFSPDGRLLACGIDWGIQLRNVQTGAEIHVMKGRKNSVMSLSFSPDGKAILSGGHDGSVKLWDVATGACLGTWKRRFSYVPSVAWSSDGTLAASGSNFRTVGLWTVAPPEELKLEPLSTGQLSDVRSVIFAADGTLLSGSYDRTCKLWDTRTKSLIRTLEHDSKVSVVAVSPNSELVACGLYDGQTVLWNKVDGIKLHAIPGPGRVLSLKFSTDDTLAAAYTESSLTLWDVNKRTPLKVLPSIGADLEAAAFSPDGIHIAVSMRSTLNITQWPMDAPSTSRQSVEHEAPFPPDGSHSTRQTVGDSHECGRVLAVSLSPNGRLIAALLPDKVGLLDVSTGEFMHTLEHKTRNLVTPIAWPPSANVVAWGDERDVCVWDIEPGGRVRRLTDHSDWVYTALFTPDEQHVLSTSNDGTIRRWDVYAAHPSSEIVFMCDGWIWALAVSSDGKWMLSGSLDSSAPDTSSPELLARPSRAPFKDPFGYPTLRLHDAAGRVLWMEHVTCRINFLAFSDDCTRAVAGSDDGRILLYDLTELLHPDTATSHPFTPLPRSGESPTVPEYEFSTERKACVKLIDFSPDGHGIVFDRRSYIPLDVNQRPLSSRNSEPSSPPAYFFVNGWLWRFTPATGCQRFCWVPSAFIPDEKNPDRSSSVHGHTIACGTRAQGVVILDASPCDPSFKRLPA